MRLLAPAERLGGDGSPGRRRHVGGAGPAEQVRRRRPGGWTENADGAAYADAVSEDAALGRDELGEGGGSRRHGGYFGSRLNFDADQK
jgi:hypothetical protein